MRSLDTNRSRPLAERNDNLTFFVPTGCTANLGIAGGTSIGTVAAQTTAADLGGAILPLTGTVQVRSATGTYLSSGAPVPLAAASTVCTGTAAHAAFWVMILQAAGQTLEVPIFLDPAAGPVTAFAAYTMVICLGNVTQGGAGVAGATVLIKAGGKVVGRAKTNASGSYKATVKLKTANAVLTATATVAAKDLGAAGYVATFAPVPCIGAIQAGFTATSKAVEVNT